MNQTIFPKKSECNLKNNKIFQKCKENTNTVLKYLCDLIVVCIIHER